MTTVNTPTRQDLEALYPGCSITHGHKLSGPGSARHGWWATTAAGDSTYLGATLEEVGECHAELLIERERTNAELNR